MKKNTSQTLALGLLAAALTTMPVGSYAQDTNQPPAAGQTAPAKPKTHNVPFNGKVAAIDTAAGTLTVGKHTLQVTSETKITKDGKPVMLADGVVGERVGGTYHKTEGGKLDAVLIHFGSKHDKENPEASGGTGK